MPDTTLTPDAFMQQQAQPPARNAGLTPDAFMQSEQPATAQAPAEQPGFFRGVWDAVNPLPAIEHYSQLAVEEQQQIHDALQKGDYKTAAKRFAQSLPGVDLATDIGRAQADQFHQAYQDWKTLPPLEGASSAFGHVLAGALPVVGPAAAQAGENIGTPGKTDYGAGQAVGLLLPFGASAASRFAGPAADVIRAAPQTPINELLAQPTQRGQTLLARQGPAVEAAGLTGKAADVKAQTAATLARTGPAIAAEAERLSAAGVLPDVQRIDAAIQDLRTTNSANGVPLSKAYDARLAQAQTQLREIATNPDSQARFRDYDKLLNQWQKEAKRSYLNPDATEAANAMKAASARFREILRDTEGTDALNALNDEHSVNQAANQLATLARPKAPQLGPLGKVAVRVGSTAVGSAVGNVLGHPYLGGEAGFLLAPQLEKAIVSGQLRRIPAAFRNSIADALARGDMATASRFATLVGQMGAQAQSAGPTAAATVEWMRSRPAAVAVP